MAAGPGAQAAARRARPNAPHGQQAIELMRREIADYDALIKADGKAVQDALPEPPRSGKVGKGRPNSFDIVKAKGGNSEAYLAAGLKRDAPVEWRAYMDGQHRSVRAAALAAGIVKPPDTYKQLCRLWEKATDDERERFRAHIAGTAEPA